MPPLLETDLNSSNQSRLSLAAILNVAKRLRVSSSSGCEPQAGQSPTDVITNVSGDESQFGSFFKNKRRRFSGSSGLVEKLTLQRWRQPRTKKGGISDRNSSISAGGHCNFGGLGFTELTVSIRLQ